MSENIVNNTQSRVTRITVNYVANIMLNKLTALLTGFIINKGEGKSYRLSNKGKIANTVETSLGKTLPRDNRFIIKANMSRIIVSKLQMQFYPSL